MQNIRGLTAEKTEHLPDVEILLLCETWLREGHSIAIPGFTHKNFYVKNVHKSAKRGCGGLSIYMHNSIQSKCQIIKGNENLAWLEVCNMSSRDDKPLAIGFVYFPPEGSTQILPSSDLFQQLEEDIVNLSRKYHTLLIGDFNAHTNTHLEYLPPVEGSEAPSQDMNDMV
jgi:hypothetical protein